MEKIKKILFVLIIALALSACGGNNKWTLTCRYDLTANSQSFEDASLNITFKQNVKTDKLTDGEVKFSVKFNRIYSVSEMNELKNGFKEQFCSEGFFGEGTTKSCDITSDENSITVNIVIDINKFVEVNKDDIEENENLLEDIKKVVEEEINDGSMKCEIK